MADKKLCIQSIRASMRKLQYTVKTAFHLPKSTATAEKKPIKLRHTIEDGGSIEAKIPQPNHVLQELIDTRAVLLDRVNTLLSKEEGKLTPSERTSYNAKLSKLRLTDEALMQHRYWLLKKDYAKTPPIILNDLYLITSVVKGRTPSLIAMQDQLQRRLNNAASKIQAGAKLIQQRKALAAKKKPAQGIAESFIAQLSKQNMHAIYMELQAAGKVTESKELYAAYLKKLTEIQAAKLARDTEALTKLLQELNKIKKDLYSITKTLSTDVRIVSLTLEDNYQKIKDMQARLNSSETHSMQELYAELARSKDEGFLKDLSRSTKISKYGNDLYGHMLGVPNTQTILQDLALSKEQLLACSIAYNNGFASDLQFKTMLNEQNKIFPAVPALDSLSFNQIDEHTFEHQVSRKIFCYTVPGEGFTYQDIKGNLIKSESPLTHYYKLGDVLVSSDSSMGATIAQQSGLLDTLPEIFVKNNEGRFVQLTAVMHSISTSTASLSKDLSRITVKNHAQITDYSNLLQLADNSPIQPDSYKKIGNASSLIPRTVSSRLLDLFRVIVNALAHTTNLIARTSPKPATTVLEVGVEEKLTQLPRTNKNIEVATFNASCAVAIDDALNSKVTGVDEIYTELGIKKTVSGNSIQELKSGLASLNSLAKRLTDSKEIDKDISRMTLTKDGKVVFNPHDETHAEISTDELATKLKGSDYLALTEKEQIIVRVMDQTVSNSANAFTAASINGDGLSLFPAVKQLNLCINKDSDTISHTSCMAYPLLMSNATGTQYYEKPDGSLAELGSDQQIGEILQLEGQTYLEIITNRSTKSEVTQLVACNLPVITSTSLIATPSDTGYTLTNEIQVNNNSKHINYSMVSGLSPEQAIVKVQSKTKKQAVATHAITTHPTATKYASVSNTPRLSTNTDLPKVHGLLPNLRLNLAKRIAARRTRKTSKLTTATRHRRPE